MGPGLAACRLLRHRLGYPAVQGEGRRAAADHRFILRRGAGKGRDRAALRSRRRQLFDLVFRAPPADRARALRRDLAQHRQRGWSGRRRCGTAHSQTGVAPQRPAPSQPQGRACLQEGITGNSRKRRDHRARARSVPGRAGQAFRRRSRCITCWNGSITGSGIGGLHPATSIIGGSSTSTRWRDYGSRMPARSRPSIGWSRG